MKTMCGALKAIFGLALLATVFASLANAQCVSVGASKRSSLMLRQPFSTSQFSPVVFSWVDDSGPDDSQHAKLDPIVGMWHVVFTANTMDGEPVNSMFDNAVVVWHSDGTEIMNSSRPAQDGNFCIGVWKQTGKLKYLLNHIPWQGNDPLGNPQGGAQLIEHVALSPDGNSYSGTFTFTAYDTGGNPGPSYTGVMAGTRITTSTKFTDLL
jgi:hypothetical protein